MFKKCSIFLKFSTRPTLVLHAMWYNHHMNIQKKSYEGCKGRSCGGGGFTLVELMVTISIIAILTGIIITNLTSSRSKARDAKRVSDLGQIQLALELYFDRCKQYPKQVNGDRHISNAMLTVHNGPGCSTSSSITLSSYISNIPTPPSGTGETTYGYDVISVNAPTNYVLHTRLENYNEVLKDSTPTHPFPSGVISGSPSGSPSASEFSCGAGTLDYCLTP